MIATHKTSKKSTSEIEAILQGEGWKNIPEKVT
jgi:hypothetical protein